MAGVGSAAPPGCGSNSPTADFDPGGYSRRIVKMHLQPVDSETSGMRRNRGRLVMPKAVVASSVRIAGGWTARPFRNESARTRNGPCLRARPRPVAGALLCDTSAGAQPQGRHADSLRSGDVGVRVGMGLHVGPAVGLATATDSGTAAPSLSASTASVSSRRRRFETFSREAASGLPGLCGTAWPRFHSWPWTRNRNPQPFRQCLRLPPARLRPGGRPGQDRQPVSICARGWIRCRFGPAALHRGVIG